MANKDVLYYYERQKMKTAKYMDETIVGPRLFCEYCGELRAISPCYTCWFLKNECNKEFCLGCGSNLNKYLCDKEFEICKTLEKERRLKEIYRCFINKSEALCLMASHLSELPSEIKQLTHLKHLNLHNNSLREFPMQIWHLVQLQELYISCNQLKKLPIQIKNFTNLQKLYLNNNLLRKLPAEVGQLANLQKLSFQDNQLKKLPREIGQLTNLKHLHLCCNQLKELPKEIGQLTNLRTLFIGSNQLKELPQEIKFLIHLQELALEKNSFSQSAIREIREALPYCEIFSDF